MRRRLLRGLTLLLPETWRAEVQGVRSWFLIGVGHVSDSRWLSGESALRATSETPVRQTTGNERVVCSRAR